MHCIYLEKIDKQNGISLKIHCNQIHLSSLNKSLSVFVYTCIRETHLQIHISSEDDIKNEQEF